MRVKKQPCPHCGGSGKIIPPGSLRELREKAGISLSELSRQAGVSVTYLSDVERGTRAGTGPRIQGIYESLAQQKGGPS